MTAPDRTESPRDGQVDRGDAGIDGWFGAEGTIVGDGRRWDQVRFDALPSAAAFMAVVTDPARLEAQQNHCEEAITDTCTMMVRPMFNRLAESVAGRAPDA